MRYLLFILLLPIGLQAQFKAYIKYFTTASYRNTEGDLIVKNNGQYYAVWSQFRNGTDDATTADLAAKYSVDSGKNWIDLGIIQENIGIQTTMSVSLVRIGHDTVHMYFLVKNSNTDLRIYRKKSFDDCVTWSAAEQAITDPGYAIVLNAKARKVASGRIVIPVSFSANVGVIPPNYLSVYAWYSDDNGSTWTKSTPTLTLSADIGYAEPGFVETSAGNLLLHMRVQTGGFQVFSNSTNNGTTWGTPYTSTLSSTGSPCSIIKLSTGQLIAVHNPVVGGFPHIRSVLRISKSVDNGATWQLVMDLESNTLNYNFAYSSTTEYNGNLLLTYWELQPVAGKYALKFASIPISQL